MSTTLLPVLQQRFFTSNGIPLVGGFLYSYLAGTSTPAATYTDETGSSSNSNPVILDANGCAEVWLGSGAYKFVLEDANNVVQFTVDNVSNYGTVTTTNPWIKNSITDGQSATNLAGITVDISTYSSCVLDCEIIRGTTVIANGQLVIQDLNGTGQVSVGAFMAQGPHGVTFSVTQSGTVVQLLAALTSGPGNGTIKLLMNLIGA